MIPSRVALAGTATLAVVIVLLASWMLFLSPSIPSDESKPLSRSIPSSRSIGWELKHNAPLTQATTVIPVEVRWPICAPGDLSWLAPPMIDYAPRFVTVTLYATDAFGDITRCATRDKDGRVMVGTYLSGLDMMVQLSEPLRGRALFDGSMFPPDARPYP